MAAASVCRKQPVAHTRVVERTYIAAPELLRDDRDAIRTLLRQLSPAHRRAFTTALWPAAITVAAQVECDPSTIDRVPEPWVEHVLALTGPDTLAAVVAVGGRWARAYANQVSDWRARQSASTPELPCDRHDDVTTSRYGEPATVLRDTWSHSPGVRTQLAAELHTKIAAELLHRLTPWGPDEVALFLALTRDESDLSSVLWLMAQGLPTLTPPMRQRWWGAVVSNAAPDVTDAYYGVGVPSPWLAAQKAWLALAAGRDLDVDDFDRVNSDGATDALAALAPAVTGRSKVALFNALAKPNRLLRLHSTWLLRSVAGRLGDDLCYALALRTSRTQGQQFSALYEATCTNSAAPWLNRFARHPEALDTVRADHLARDARRALLARIPGVVMSLRSGPRRYSDAVIADLAAELAARLGEHAMAWSCAWELLESWETSVIEACTAARAVMVTAHVP